MSDPNLPATVSRSQDVAPATIDVHAMDKMASAVARSGLFALTEPQAFTLMLLAHSRGLHPAQAFERYHVINNRPAMKADAMLAEFQRAGGVVTWARHDDDACQATFTCPGVGSPVTITWTREDAKRAQLLRNPMWDKYPRQMLRARVISEGVRTVFPGVCVGTYTVEEVQDMAASVPAASQEYTFVDHPTPQATPQDTPQAAEQETAQAAPPKPADWDELALKNRAKEIVNEKAILEITQKRLWKDSGHDWAKFIELLEQEPDPIF